MIVVGFSVGFVVLYELVTLRVFNTMGRQSRTIKSWKVNQNENLDHFFVQDKDTRSNRKNKEALVQSNKIKSYFTHAWIYFLL